MDMNRFTIDSLTSATKMVPASERGISATFAAMIDRADPERLARIERLIAEYQSVQRDRMVGRAMRLWRSAEADQRLAEFEAPQERIH